MLLEGLEGLAKIAYPFCCRLELTRIADGWRKAVKAGYAVLSGERRLAYWHLSSRLFRHSSKLNRDSFIR
jgi:hypothetical protein